MSIALAALGMTAPVAVATPAVVPTGFSDTVVTSVALPVGLDFTPDGRMLVTTKPGHLYAYRSGKLTQAFDASGFVCAGQPGQDERGMLSVAVDPDFASNHFIYLYYSASEGGSCVNRVSRFTLDSSSQVAASSEKILIDGIQGDGFHNAGDLAFGKDGDLYVAVGDGHCLEGCDPGNKAAQDLKNLNGKILRITSSGAVPAGNPYSGTGTARCSTGPISSGKCQEIYAYGFRNPFRIATDPNAAGTRIFVDDVGQNTTEEVDQLKAGANYGWPMCEGPCNTSGLTDPVFSYPDNTGGGRAAITGGAFVPDNAWNAAYNGRYLFSDYVKNNVYSITGSGGNFTTFSAGATAVAMKFAPAVPGAGGGQQALYYTNLTTGTVHRVSSGGTVPNAAFSTSPGGAVSYCSTHASTAGAPPFTVTFDGSASGDPNGRPLTYHWTFGDAATQQTTTPTTTHTYTTKGAFTPQLTVSNDSGGTSTAATGAVRTDDAPPAVTVTSPGTSSRFTVGATYTPTGTAVDSSGAALPSSALTWQVWLFHINHVHPVLDPVAGNGSTAFVAPPAEQFSAIKGNSRLLVCLSATDANGVTQTVEQDFDPQLVQLTLGSSPSGLRIHIDEDDVDVGGDVTTPATVTSWAGYQIHLTAPDQTDSSGTPQTFGSWSDGGARSHAVAPTVDSGYTATFSAGAAQKTYEAESPANTLVGGAAVATCAPCSGGKKVGHVGNGKGVLTFDNVAVATAGTYQLTIGYCDGSTGRSAAVSVNGAAAQTVAFAGTGSFTTPGTKVITVTLKAGANTVSFANSSGWAPDFDRITV
ncbi:PQQ-dependent sugar dehydrogenase [Streptacidiphilus sp. MAP12-16]|uniref:PQQ-dependent sugar dehydrogenase n=1 Tax=Streptacidiphilus sp. MAP12-16 TaxID=3156300 RepID=UPI003512E09B